MKKDRFKIIPVANFIVEQEGKLLLLYRDDGFFKGGYWVLPGGHIDGRETARRAAVRELKEEINITLTEDDLAFVHVVHNLSETQERFDFFFRVQTFSGKVRNNEQDKCRDMAFFAYDALPPRDKMSDTTLLALEGMKKGSFYSERGFTEGNQGFSALDNFTFDTLENALEKASQGLSEEKLITKIRAEMEKKSLSPSTLLPLLATLAHLQGEEIRALFYKAFQGSEPIK